MNFTYSFKEFYIYIYIYIFCSVSWNIYINCRIYQIHEIANNMGKLQYKDLLFFYAATGSDETCSLYGLEKRKALEAWKFIPEITRVFTKMDTTIGIKKRLKLNKNEFDLLQKFF